MQCCVPKHFSPLVSTSLRYGHEFVKRISSHVARLTTAIPLVHLAWSPIFLFFYGRFFRPPFSPPPHPSWPFSWTFSFFTSFHGRVFLTTRSPRCLCAATDCIALSLLALSRNLTGTVPITNVHPLFVLCQIANFPIEHFWRSFTRLFRRSFKPFEIFEASRVVVGGESSMTVISKRSTPPIFTPQRTCRPGSQEGTMLCSLYCRLVGLIDVNSSG